MDTDTQKQNPANQAFDKVEEAVRDLILAIAADAQPCLVSASANLLEAVVELKLMNKYISQSEELI